MTEAWGQEQLCGFCGNEKGVVGKQLGNVEAYVCVDCIKALNAGATQQMIDVADITSAVALKDKTLVVQLFGFKKEIGIGSNDAALVAGQVADFFTVMRSAITSGRLAEMRIKQVALRKVRDDRREAEKNMPTLTAEVVGARANLSAMEKRLADVLAEKKEAENRLEAAQSAEDLARQKVKAAENEDLRLVNDLKQALDALGASGLF